MGTNVSAEKARTLIAQTCLVKDYKNRNALLTVPGGGAGELS